MNNTNLSNVIAKGILKAVFLLSVLVLSVWFVIKISPVITYLVISFPIVILGQPVKNFLMQRLKFSNILATTSVIIIFLILIISIITLFVPLLIQQGQNLSVLNSEAFQAKISDALSVLNDFLKSHGIDWVDELSVMDVIKKINLSYITGFVESIAGMLGNLFVGLFSVIFISFFLLKDRSLTSKAIFKLIPEKEHGRYAKVIENIKKLLAGYLSGLLLQIFILFLIYNITLHLLGVPNATIIAFLSALLNLIPYVGPLIGFALMITLSVTAQLDSMDTSVMWRNVKYISLMYAGAQLLDNFWTQPFIYSRSVKSHPLEIFLVILISANLFGVLGMIIAVPAYTVLKILLREFYSEYRRYFVFW
jgi:predicted PurR-regulated permease PerM